MMLSFAPLRQIPGPGGGADDRLARRRDQRSSSAASPAIKVLGESASVPPGAPGPGAISAADAMVKVCCPRGRGVVPPGWIERASRAGPRGPAIPGKSKELPGVSTDAGQVQADSPWADIPGTTPPARGKRWLPSRGAVSEMYDFGTALVMRWRVLVNPFDDRHELASLLGRAQRFKLEDAVTGVA